jgi:trehalose 6-phosphate synthase/phosphatase
MMFLGYYGTLVNFTKNPQDAKPDSPLFQLLKRLKI